jgi:hypothetical protein
MDNDLFKQTDDNTDHSGVDPLELIKQKFGEVIISSNSYKKKMPNFGRRYLPRPQLMKS